MEQVNQCGLIQIRNATCLTPDERQYKEGKEKSKFPITKFRFMAEHPITVKEIQVQAEKSLGFMQETPCF